MDTQIEPIRSPGAPQIPAVDLYSAVLSGRSAHTVAAYQGDYGDFARFLRVEGPGQALNVLISLPHGSANATALGYRAHLQDRRLSPATVGRRLAALKSAVKLARQLGLVAWMLDVESPRAERYRDTAGPGRDGWHRLLDTATARATTPLGRRDLAILRLLHDLALRRGEVESLDLGHVDLAESKLQVLGKGKSHREELTIPQPTRAALADWIEVRGHHPGPLFHRLDRAKGDGQPSRLTGRAIHQLVGELGRSAGLSRHLRPHGLRHRGITRALEATGGDVTAAKRFSRHAKVETLMVYDDRRRDVAGDVARQVAED